MRVPPGVAPDEPEGEQRHARPDRDQRGLGSQDEPEGNRGQPGQNDPWKVDQGCNPAGRQPVGRQVPAIPGQPRDGQRGQ